MNPVHLTETSGGSPAAQQFHNLLRPKLVIPSGHSRTGSSCSVCPCQPPCFFSPLPVVHERWTPQLLPCHSLIFLQLAWILASQPCCSSAKPLTATTKAFHTVLSGLSSSGFWLIKLRTLAQVITPTSTFLCSLDFPNTTFRPLYPQSGYFHTASSTVSVVPKALCSLFSASSFTLQALTWS